MDEKLYEEDQPPQVENAEVSKDWLKNTDKSIARLQNVKKTYYRLGGGPKEREVDCRCNYRSKNPTSFVNMEADPPQMSQQSQETASYQDVPISDLVKALNKPAIPRQKRRPYSAITSRASNTGHSEETPTGNKPFIAVKGQNLNFKSRPASAVHPSRSHQINQAHRWHLDYDQIEKEEQAKMEGLRKYSAYGQDVENPINTDLPKPPRVSPEPPEYTSAPPESRRHDISPVESSDDFISDDEDDELDLELEQVENSASPSTSSKPLILQIPTAEYSDDDVDDAATPLPRANKRALSADYVEKSEMFLDELAKKQEQEAEELTEMFSKMNQNQERVENIDLRSVISSPATARDLTTPSTLQGNSGVNVRNMSLDGPTNRESPTESMWVEEPYIPRIIPNHESSHIPMGRFHNTKIRAQSAKTRRSQEEETFVLRGRTFELMDAKDLAVTKRLTDATSAGNNLQSGSAPKKDEVLGKPPRPKSSSLKKKNRANSATNAKSKQRKSHEEEIRTHPSLPRKSSMRKCMSQDDVRCLSPEVIANVKKTVSFSDEVLNKPPRLSKTNGNDQKKETKMVETQNEGKPDHRPPSVGKPEVVQPEAELASPESTKLEKSIRNPLDVTEETLFSTDRSPEKKAPGFVIENGLEAKELDQVHEQRPAIKVPPNEKAINVIAKVKEVTRCSCHVDGCHCRDITRPTMAVLSQARAANQDQANLPPKQKLLKHRPSRPTSAPMKRDMNRISTNTTQTRITSAIQHKRSGSEGNRRPRPVSAHIKRPSGSERRKDYQLKSSKDSKSKKTKENNGQSDIGFVWGPGDEELAASEECLEVYAKFKEKGINVSMETVKRGLMAPARRASENCMASFGLSSSSGLLSRPENWLPEEYKRVKIWDKALKKL